MTADTVSGPIRVVPQLALFSGGVLMALAAVMALAVWIHASGRPPLLLPQPPPQAIAASLAAATNLEATRQACAVVAQTYDAQTLMIRTLSGQLVTLLNLVGWGVITVGFVVGSVFLYIYFATRRVFRS